MLALLVIADVIAVVVEGAVKYTYELDTYGLVLLYPFLTVTLNREKGGVRGGKVVGRGGLVLPC